MEQNATMAELYERMKDALRHFGLRFNEMHLVRANVSGHWIEFWHGEDAIKYRINRPQK